MEIEAFERISNFNFKSAAQIDSFKSLRNTRYFHKADQFVLVVPATAENVKLFVPDTLIRIVNVYHYVDNVKSSEGDELELTVSGRSLIGKAGNRITWRTYSKTARPETIAYENLMAEVINPSDAKRKIDYLSADVPINLTGATIQYQNSYGVVLDQIESLCETYGFGFYEVATSIKNPKNNIVFFKGDDLSGNVEFSVSEESLLNESYENSNDDESTTAIIYGEGEGAARQSVVVNSVLSGLERKEIYVDARDLQQESDGVTMTNAQYIEALKNRGNQSLAERQPILRLDGDIDLNSQLFIFNRDYGIGDKVRITSKQFNLSKVATLIGVEETWDSGGHHLLPIWDKETTTILDKIKRK